MFNNVALDVFIGMTFVFLMYSLLASILKEFVARIFSLRGKMLYKGIRRMLEDGTKQRDFITKFYEHPSIKYLAENKIFKKPSYLKADTFSQTLVQILRGENYDASKNQMQEIKNNLDDQKNKVAKNGFPNIAPETLKQLKNLHIDAQGDIDRFKQLLEQWFEEMMQRTTGWYTRQNQWILLIIGFLVAAWGNVDSISIYKLLARDKTAREQFVQLAIQSQAKYAPVVKAIKDSTAKKNAADTTNTKIITTGDSVLDKAYTMTLQDINKAGSILGTGWGTDSCRKCDSLKEVLNEMELKIERTSNKTIKDSLNKQYQHLDSTTEEFKKLNGCSFGGYWDRFWDTFFSRTFFGWLITALALSLGAPFWFDLLNKFINMRSTGSKPEVKDNSINPPPKTDGSTTPSPLQRKG